MKRALAALGTFIALAFGVLAGVAPAAATTDGCIQSATCAPAKTYDGADPAMTYNGTDPGMTHDGVDMTHNGVSVICRGFPPC